MKSNILIGLAMLAVIAVPLQAGDCTLMQLTTHTNHMSAPSCAFQTPAPRRMLGASLGWSDLLQASCSRCMMSLSYPALTAILTEPSLWISDSSVPVHGLVDWQDFSLTVYSSASESSPRQSLYTQNCQLRI